MKQIWSIFDDPILEEEEGDNRDKLNQGSRSNIKDLDILSSGDGQDQQENDGDLAPESEHQPSHPTQNLDI